MLGVANSGEDFAKHPSCDGAIDIGPDCRNAYSIPIATFPNNVLDLC